eukprot:CAMPEP_0170559988 /NCGR_PEP_ID=MMETSP0211-20121228/46304_1 /TAXON_ID=311385 /ORGANISM="Pseudokeronopsis sp., Strain OXSARD2" /LENGTH=46 /DNA_ID= /DNA_START= /DNA_END= /DNA_ORIENTATION=
MDCFTARSCDNVDDLNQDQDHNQVVQKDDNLEEELEDYPIDHPDSA